MKNFLHKYVYITILKDGTELYYTCAYVTEVTDNHISFIDKIHNDEPFFYKIDDVINCKLSNKVDNEGNFISNRSQNGEQKNV